MKVEVQIQTFKAKTVLMTVRLGRGETGRTLSHQYIVLLQRLVAHPRQAELRLDEPPEGFSSEARNEGIDPDCLRVASDGAVPSVSQPSYIFREGKETRGSRVASVAYDDEDQEEMDGKKRSHGPVIAFPD